MFGGIWIPGNSEHRHTSISKEDVRKLQILQNKTMRIELGLDYKTPTKELKKKADK